MARFNRALSYALVLRKTSDGGVRQEVEARIGLTLNGRRRHVTVTASTWLEGTPGAYDASGLRFATEVAVYATTARHGGVRYDSLEAFAADYPSFDPELSPSLAAMMREATPTREDIWDINHGRGRQGTALLPQLAA